MTKEISAAQVADKALDKASDLVEKVADTAGNVFDAAAGIIGKGIEQYGQSAIDAVLWTVRIDAIQSLLYGFILFLIGMGTIVFIWTGFTKRNWNKRIESLGTDAGAGAVIVVILCSSLAVVTSFVGTVKLTDVWKWTAVAKPEIYLVKKTIDIVEQKVTK